MKLFSYEGNMYSEYTQSPIKGSIFATCRSSDGVANPACFVMLLRMEIFWPMDKQRLDLGWGLGWNVSNMCA
jgi:hypothetical protein